MEILIAYTKYTRDYQPIDIEVFSDKREALTFLREELNFGQYFDDDENDQPESSNNITLERMCEVIQANFAGDGGESVTAVSVKVDGEYLLRL